MVIIFGMKIKMSEKNEEIDAVLKQVTLVQGQETIAQIDFNKSTSHVEKTGHRISIIFDSGEYKVTGHTEEMKRLYDQLGVQLNHVTK